MPQIIALTLLIITHITSQAHAKSETQLPYFASIKADEANVRTGPSVRYPIQWVYQKKQWPIKITATFESWRKIEDVYGEAGWIHESLISSKRNIIINSKGVQELYRLPVKSSQILLIAENGVIGQLLSCREHWCKIKISGKKGWIESKNLWGRNPNEQID